MTNQKDPSNKTIVNVNELAETASTSLDKSQKNATDTERAVQQVISMTGEELHKDTVAAILNDQTIDIEKKIKLVHDENADYDARLQSTQTRNVGAVINWCSEHWIWFAIAGTLGIGAVTPPGQKLIASAAGRIKALPA